MLSSWCLLFSSTEHLGDVLMVICVDPSSFSVVAEVVFWVIGWVQITSLVAQMVKRLPTMQETWVWSLGQEDSLEKEMATHSSALAWKILWTEEAGRLQSMVTESDTTERLHLNVLKKFICIPSMTSGDESQTFVIQVSLYVLPAYVILSAFLCGWSFLHVFWILILCWVHFKYLLWGCACLQSWSLVSMSLLQNSSGLPALPASFVDCFSCAGHWTILIITATLCGGEGILLFLGVLRLRREGANPGDTGRERAGNPRPTPSSFRAGHLSPVSLKRGKMAKCPYELLEGNTYGISQP